MGNSKLFKLVFYVLATVLVLYFIFSTLPAFFTDDISGQVIDVVSYDDYITIEGIALRNETLLFANTDFTSVEYSGNNGDRLAKGSVCAFLSSGTMDSVTCARTAKLERKISEIKESISKNTKYDIVSAEDNIKNDIISLLNGADDLNFKVCDELSCDVQIAMNRRQMKFSETNAFSDILEQCEAELASISGSANSRTSELYAPMAGYFYSGFDGYEYLYYTDYIDLTVSDFYKLYSKTAQPVPDRYIGKMQNEPVWKFYSIIDSQNASSLSVGKSVQLEFDIDLVGRRKLNATVEYISKSENGQTAVTFSFNTMYGELFTLRKEKCKMIVKTYTGFEVSNAAIRVRDGETGVYVLSGQRIIFKPVEIAYSTEDISIINTKTNSGSRALMNKDTVIIGGKDLFDGKVVNVASD